MTAIVSDWAISWTGGRQPQSPCVPRPPHCHSRLYFIPIMPVSENKKQNFAAGGKCEFPNAIIGVGRVAVKGQSPS